MRKRSWIIKNQKGLSAIVATLIIILLVLVAVGIVWVVVQGIIKEGAEGIELGKFTLDLEIKRVQIEDNDVTVVVVKRNPGEGNFIGMNFIFSDGTNSEIIRENTILQETEEKSFTFTLNEISTENLKTISVAPIFELSSGKESIGNIADDFDISEEMKAGITSSVISNFEALGFKGMGKVEYGPFSSDTPQLLEFKKAIVDPLDVLPGDNQTFTVHVYSPYSIVNVTTTTQLDNSTLNLDLEKIGNYTENEENIEIWSANWIVNDVHTTTYRTTIIATDSEGNENSITLTWTDSCQAAIGAHGGDRIIDQDCNTGTNVNGVDGGSLTIASGRTVVIASGGTLAFNDGKSITVTGTITVTGQIQKSNLYYTDSDGDDYASSATLALSGGVRAKDALGTSDCNDGNINAWSYGYGYDGDNDNYGTSSYGCNNGPANYDATAGQDCCDTDSRAKPGQETYYTTPRSGGCAATYDFNCVGGDQKEPFPTGGRCYECWWDDLFCEINYEGSTGWQSSAPACGSPDTYFTNAGNECARRSQSDCSRDCFGASSGPRTQACR